MLLQSEKYQKIFATPFFRFHFPEHTKLNAALLEEGHSLRSKKDGVSKSNKGGWHSEGNLFNNPAASIKVLNTLAVDAVVDATSKIGAKVDPKTLKLKLFAWMNMNPTGGFNAPHTHPGAHWSGVYYVAQPQIEKGDSGMIEFLDPRSDLPNWRLLDAPPFRIKKKLRPVPGDLILFPSYLLHWVYPNEANGERVTVAFNATFKKTGKAG
ncbi:TIGR02466 family protein [Aliiroseovarius sp. YM-037]|uniref:TIGR02466 family protein n=1 Tax=Aliiroseovarius sp. YM-037 TaxID=3341728 RepID=UPI003A7F9336